jgi:hypothetical protein
VNKKYVGTANVINGIAKISWMIPSNWNTGNYSIGADYLGTSKYAISTNTSILTVDPSAYLYLQIHHRIRIQSW